MNTQTSLEAYEEKQTEIKKLLAQIVVGLKQHDRNASGRGGHNWGHVGDLNQMVTELTNIRDRLLALESIKHLIAKGGRSKSQCP